MHIPTKDNLLNIRVTSFCQKEVDLLRYVENKKLIDLDMLDGFSVEVCELLEKYTNMPSDRAEKIAQTIVQKVEYLKLFQQGKKIVNARAGEQVTATYGNFGARTYRLDNVVQFR